MACTAFCRETKSRSDCSAHEKAPLAGQPNSSSWQTKINHKINKNEMKIESLTKQEYRRKKFALVCDGAAELHSRRQRFGDLMLRVRYLIGIEIRNW